MWLLEVLCPKVSSHLTPLPISSSTIYPPNRFTFHHLSPKQIHSLIPYISCREPQWIPLFRLHLRPPETFFGGHWLVDPKQQPQKLISRLQSPHKPKMAEALLLGVHVTVSQLLFINPVSGDAKLANVLC